MSRVLVIGDTHLPFEKEGYLKFCKDMKKKHRCNRIVHIGDIVDNHALSRHETEVHARSGYSEYTKALEKMEIWKKTFPNMDIIIGNHDRIPHRQAKKLGLHSGVMKTLKEQWNMPKGWNVVENLVIDNVYYTHGDTSGGINGTLNFATNNGMSTVVGHKHSASGVRYLTMANGKTIFGMDTGCGIDKDQYAFYYGKDMPKKPVLSVGIVIDGKKAYIEIMGE
jgi:predicted phosphodiesterase